MEGCLKLNFDGGSVSDTTWGWGFVRHNHHRDIVLAGAKHGMGFARSLVEEARLCLFGIKCAYEVGVRNIVIEGDCLVLIQMLQSSSIDESTASLFVKEILAFVNQFEFYSWSFVKRGGNRVAHALGHWQPLCLEGMLWEVDFSEDILTRASKDMCDFIGLNLK